MASPYDYATNAFLYDYPAYFQRNSSLLPDDSNQPAYQHGVSGMSFTAPLYAVAPAGHAVQGQHDSQFFTGDWVIAESPTMISTTTRQSDPLVRTTPPSTLGRPLEAPGDGLDARGEQTPLLGEGSPAKKRNLGEKTHKCFMCTKSFDRPSTLKKHLLVHTGEKPFTCEGCSRRFGLPSNLKRHKQTCRFVHAACTGPGTSSPRNSSSDTSPPTSNSHVSGIRPTTTIPTSPDANLRTAAALDEDAHVSVIQHHHAQKEKGVEGNRNLQSPQSGLTAPEELPQRRKRTRRAPSPAHWVPESLQMFDLTPVTTSTSIPLQPVRPSEGPAGIEERDSFDENASSTPYHPQGWSGRLPGPGLIDKDAAHRRGGQILTF